MNERTPFIDLRDVRKVYPSPAGDFSALRGIDLVIYRGEFVAVVGKSGAGKSTLINMVTGIDRPTSGAIRVGEQAIHLMTEDALAAWRGRNTGVIFQFFQLLPMLTCAQNVMMPMDFAAVGGSPRQRYDRARRLLERVGIGEQADKLPAAVSGGQRQRVAIARALATDPDLLVADEPTGNLDSRTAGEMIEVFHGLVADGKTILLVTHDRDLAGQADRRVHLADGQIVDRSGP